MSNSNGFIRRMIPLGLCTFLWAGSPATAQTESSGAVAGRAERTPVSVTGVRAEINSEGTSVTVSWELSESDRVNSVPVGGDLTAGGAFVGVNGVEDYNIWRQGAEDTEPTLVATVNAGETSFVDESFVLGTTYTYSVTATAPAGDNESAPTEADTPIDVGPPPAVTLTLDQASLGEGDGVAAVTVTATLSSAWSLNTPVELSISDAGTAEQAEGRDYTAEWTGQTITIAAGESEGSATLLVSVNDDNLAEGDIVETILLEGTSAVSGGANETADLAVAGTEITLTDNDVAPTSITLTVDTANLDEGAGETAVEVTATLGDGSTALLTDTAVALSLSGTHVDLGPDYEAGEVTITIPAEQTGASSPLTLTPNDDNLAEGDETIEVSGAADGFTVESASIGLTDNDVAPTSIALEVDNSTFGEGDEATVTVTATLGDGSTALLNDTEVALAVAESDENAAAAGAVTIAAGETSASGSITLTLLEENLVDGDKTIALVGTAAGYDIGDIELTVTDNDVAPTSITLEVDASTFDEGDGDATITVTATLGDGSTALLNDTEVALAVAESDENAAAAGAVTIAAGETSASGSITLTLLEENLVDGDKTIALVGTAAGYDIGDIELTVTDNDVAPTSITLEVDASTFDEGDGDATITVTATLGDGSTALLNDTEVALAVAESDENAAAAGAVTIAAGETSASGSITLTLLEENLVDGDKTIALVGTAAGYDIGDIELTVTDNDVAPTSITLEVDASTFDEGDGDATITVTATLGDGSTALLNDTEVALAVAESDENAAAAGAVTIAAGETSASGSITLTLLEENLVDGDKTIALVGTAAGYDIGDIELTVTDNDVAPTSITLEVDASTFDEGDGDATITVTATLGDGSTALLNDTEVALAVAESDENAAAAGAVTIAAGETSASGSITLTLLEENLVDGDKTIALVGTAAGYDIGDIELTVTDNDVAPTSITLEVDASTFDEGDGDATITVTATLGDGSTALLNDTEVALAVAESDENAAAAGAVTIAAGETSASGSITLTLLEENLVDGDKTIALVGTAAGYDIGDIELTVTDNDVAPTSITLEVDASTFDEGDGDATITVTATLGDGSTALLNDTEVALAVAESDENAAAAGAVTIAAGETSASGSITLTLLEENLVDGDKTIALVGTAAGYDIGDIELTVTDNDVAPTSITLEVDASTFDEGDGDATITVTATLGDGSTALLNDTEVALAVAESDENAAAAGAVTIAAGETSASGSITLTLLEENLVDGDKTIALVGTAAGYDIGDIELTVTDNDVAPTSITLEVDASTFDEGDGDATITVTATLGDGSTALLNDTEVALAVAESDENAAAAGAVTIAAGETSASGSITLTLLEENLVDGDKTIALVGTAAGYDIGDIELTVTDNDVAPTSITLEVDASTFDEGDGDATITVTATLGDGSTALLNDTEVALAVAESDENAAAAGAVTIAAGETSASGSITLTLLEENLVDGDKIILLTGTAGGYDIGDVELTVTDNDVAPTTITLSVDTDSFDEGDGETAVTVTAVLGDGSTALLNDTQITLSLSGTAEDGSDYTASIPTITVAAEQTSGSGVLTLTPPDDELIPEYEETIVVEGAADGFTVASATIAITDNDDEPTVVNPIPAMILYVGGAEGVMELSGKFRGLDMTYSATSSAPGVATVSVEGSQVTVSAVIEGESSIEVTAMNTIGPDASQAFAVTVMTEPNETQIVGDALAAIGRTTLSSVSSAIGTRFASRPSSTMMTLAGYSLLSKGGASHLGARGFGLQPELRYAQASRNEMSWKQALRNTSFAVPMGEGGGSDPGLPNWTLWGLGDYNTFEGTPDYGSHSGTVTSVYLGVDKSVAQRAQLGVTVSYSMGETDYDFEGDGASGSGALTTVLTSVYPYLRFAPSAGMDIWALGGVGVGTAENERGVTSTTEESDLSMTLGLLGARQSLGTMGGLDMALRGDAGMVNLSTAEGEGVIADQAVAAQRFRLGVEGGHTFQMASCAKVTPYGELSGRFDGGDGQTGGGLEAAGGLRYECPRSRFRFEARGRILALNSAYSESGGSVMASYSPGADGLGLSMALAPHWGASGGGARALWRDNAFRTIGRLGSLRDDWSMDAQVGYGMRVQPLPGVLTPFAQFMPAGAGEQMRLGVRFEGLGGTAFEMLDLNLSAGRVDRRQRYAEHRVDVRGAMYF